MKCSNCYNEVPKDSKICPICNTIFATYFEDRILTKKQRIKLFLHKMFFPFLLIFPLIILVLIVIIKFNIKFRIINENVVRDNNLLYESTDKYYKYVLTKKEKEIYDIIINSIRDYKEIIEIDLSQYDIEPRMFTYDTLRNIKHVLSMDHPELINLGTINVLEVENNNVKLIVNYAVGKDSLEESITELVKTLEPLKEDTNVLSEYDKINYVFEYLSNVENTDELDTKYYSAYGCLVLNKCNMYGYAKAVQIIFTNININSMLVTGTLNSRYHEWNIVKIGNEYYNYDQSNNKKFFKDSNYELYHKNVIPQINGKKYIIK